MRGRKALRKLCAAHLDEGQRQFFRNFTNDRAEAQLVA
jgi:hypothetical protein